jgi:hypothetical protein
LHRALLAVTLLLVTEDERILIRLAKLSALQQQIQDERHKLARHLLGNKVPKATIARAMGTNMFYIPGVKDTKTERRLRPMINGKLVTVD